jgi:cell division protease FtsH
MDNDMKKKTSFSVSYIFIAFFLLLLIQYLIAPKAEHVSYTQFKNLIKKGEITSVVVSSNLLKGFEKIESQDRKEPLFPKHVFVTPRVDDKNLVPFLEENKVDIIAENEQTFFKTLLSWILPALIFVGIWMFAMKRMGQGAGIMTLGKHKAKIVAHEDIGVTFNDVAGQDEAKAELKEILEFLKSHEKFSEIGARIPKGILLVGPPGTGKTLLAKAVAGEAGVPFFSISGSDFIEMFVGLGAARVRDLFEQANKIAPCVVFIDELDALGKARGVGAAGGHDEREQTLNQLLVEMDGFQTNKGVVILAATNRPEILDLALLRPGRFDRQILVDRPDLSERIEILKVHAKNVRISKDADLEVIARRTPGFTGADLANLINEAALLSVRKGKREVESTDLEEAVDRIIAGLEKKNRVLNEKEKKIVAYHETGHALVAAFRPTAEKVHKITIVPRGIGALGFTLQLPTEDRYLMTETELLEKIDVLLGGRMAEEVIFGEITTGAHNDLEKSTDIARSMVTMYGMSDKLGQVTYRHQTNPYLQQQGIFSQQECSTFTNKLIDEEVKEIIDTRSKMVKQLLTEKIDILHLVAQELMKKETLDEDNFTVLVEQGKAALQEA